MADIDPSSALPGGLPSAAPDPDESAESSLEGVGPSLDRYKTACDIHDHLEIMIQLATAANLSAATLDLLDRAKTEASRVMRRKRERDGAAPPRGH